MRSLSEIKEERDEDAGNWLEDSSAAPPQKRSAPRQTGRICHAGKTTKVNFCRQLDWIKKHLLSHVLAQASNPSSREAEA